MQVRLSELNSMPSYVSYQRIFFIVYKDTPHKLRFVGSMFFQKVCTEMYCKFDM